MDKKLERDFLEADLAAIDALLAAHGEDVDPIGYIQFTHRKQLIAKQLLDLQSGPQGDTETVMPEAQAEEKVEQLIGTLYVLPAARQFEFTRGSSTDAVSMSGTISDLAAAQIAGQQKAGDGIIDPRHISTRPMRVEIQTSEIRELNRAPRRVHHLLGLMGYADDR